MLWWAHASTCWNRTCWHGSDLKNARVDPRRCKASREIPKLHLMPVVTSRSRQKPPQCCAQLHLGLILAMDQAKLCSFREIELWVQHLFLSHERAQPQGFASVTLQQIIECDKQMFIRASNNLVGELQSEPGAAETPLDKELKSLRASPELMPYLMPMPVKPQPVKPAAANPNKRGYDTAPEPAPKYQKGKGKGTTKGKSKGAANIDIPPGCVVKTPDGKPLCFAFNKTLCKYKGTGPRCQRG